jgi:hypothetical protein
MRLVILSEIERIVFFQPDELCQKSSPFWETAKCLINLPVFRIVRAQVQVCCVCLSKKASALILGLSAEVRLHEFGWLPSATGWELMGLESRPLVPQQRWHHLGACPPLWSVPPAHPITITTVVSPSHHLSHLWNSVGFLWATRYQSSL